MTAHPIFSQLLDFWGGALPPETAQEEPVNGDSPPDDDPAALYREAYYAGMADGPAPGAD